MRRPAVFLDRDGTVIWDPACPARLNRVRPLHAAAEWIVEQAK